MNEHNPTTTNGSRPSPRYLRRRSAMRTPTKCALVLGLLAISTGAASAAFRGYVSLPWTPTTCGQESHFLSDPCTGTLTILRESVMLDIDPFLCSSVVVDGPNIGIECQVIQPTSAVPSPPSCPNQFTISLTGDAITDT